MIQVLVTFEPATGQIRIETDAPPVVVNLVLDAAQNAARQHALAVLAQQLAGGIQRPTAAQQRELLGSGNGKGQVQTPAPVG